MERWVFESGDLPANAILGGAGGLPAWAPSTHYIPNQVATVGTDTYVCINDHTSGGSFVAGSDWRRLGSTLSLATPAGAASQDMLLIGVDGASAARLPVGTNGQQVNVRSDGTVQWVTPSAIQLSAWQADATGVTDASVRIQNAVNACAAAGGGRVEGQVGGVYKMSSQATLSTRNASGSVTSGVPYAVTIPSNVILDGKGATFAMDPTDPGIGGTAGIVFTNPTRNPATVSTQVDHDLGLMNMIVDGGNIVKGTINNNRGLVEIANVLRPTLINVKVQNGQATGLVGQSNVLGSYDMVVADTIAGAGLSFGQSQPGTTEDRATFGTLIARNCTVWPANALNAPGNGIICSATNSQAKAMLQENCSGGIKINIGSMDFQIGKGQVIGGANSTGNSGFKIQGPSQSNIAGPTRVHVDQVHCIANQGPALFMEGCIDCSVGTYFGTANGMQTAPDVWIGGIRDKVGKIVSNYAGGNAVHIRPYARDFSLPNIEVRNPNQLWAVLPTTTVAAGSNGQTNPATILVASLPAGIVPQLPTSFPLAGQLTIGGNTVTYTGVQLSPPAFLGCSGAGTLSTGQTVTPSTAFANSGASGFQCAGGTGRVGKLRAVDEIAVPFMTATLQAGGSFGAGAQCWMATAVNANGETVGSVEVILTLTAGQQAALNIVSAIPGATGYNFYRSTTSGGEVTGTTQLVNAAPVAFGSLPYIDTGAALNAGACPSINTASRKAMNYGFVVTSAPGRVEVDALESIGHNTAAYNIPTGPVIARNVSTGPPATASIVLPGTVSSSPLSNYAAVTDPVVGSDNTLGYGVGSEWCNTATSVLFKCVSAATGAAVWRRVNGVKVDVFTVSGTWVKPNWVQKVTVAVIASGCGGGSGARQPSGTATSGGAGGGGGAFASAVYNAAELASSVTVGVGVAGTGAPAITVDGTNGSQGVGGSQSSFGPYLRAQPGTGGGGGTAGATSTAGAGGTGFSNGQAGAACASGGAGLNATSTGPMGAPGGGSGGGLAATPVGLTGGNGGGTIPLNFTAGGTGGATDGASGNPGASALSVAGSANLALPGSGGGGGASSNSTTGGNGGNGGNYGAGGGGGGSALNGHNSGKGGDGGSGLVVVISE